MFLQKMSSYGARVWIPQAVTAEMRNTVVTLGRSLMYYLSIQFGINEASLLRPAGDPRVTTPALILWQSTRHLVAENRYSGKVYTNKSDVVVGDTRFWQYINEGSARWSSFW